MARKDKTRKNDSSVSIDEPGWTPWPRLQWFHGSKRSSFTSEPLADFSTVGVEGDECAAGGAFADGAGLLERLKFRWRAAEREDEACSSTLAATLSLPPPSMALAEASTGAATVAHAVSSCML